MALSEVFAGWFKRKLPHRNGLQTALYRRGMKPDEGYKLKYDSWSKVYRFRYYNDKQRRWI